MAFQHDPVSLDPDQAFVFTQLFGWSCSICAPLSWPEARVEAFARDAMGTAGWQSVDAARQFGQMHGPTPYPCSQAPTLRQHWLLLRDR